MKMSFKNVGFILVLGACTLIGASSFANGPKVYWNDEVLYAADSSVQNELSGRCLNNESFQEKMCPVVAQMITQKLNFLKSNGKLPFEIVKMGGDRSNFDAKGLAQTSDGKVQLMIPVIIGDTYHRDSAVYNGQTYYKYDVKTMINLFFCEIGEDYDGHMGVHVVYNVPMMAYATPGSGFELSSPIDEKLLAKQAFLNAKYAVAQDLEFPMDFDKYLSSKKTADIARVYQVTDVGLCGYNRLGTVYPMVEQRLEIQKTIADAFTSKFAKVNKKCIVLPSPYSGQAWQRKIVEYIHSFKGISDCNVDFQEKASKSIKLNVAEWKLSNIDMGKFYDGHYDNYNLTIAMDANIGDKQLKRGTYTNKYEIGKNTVITMALNWNELFALAADRVIKGK